MLSRDHFKNKRIAVIGLGAEGEMISDIKFLIKAGAFVSLYDMRSEARLKTELALLRDSGLASYVCGSIPADDLLDMSLIILSHDYPRTSSFLSKAESAGIAIEYPETFFFKQAPPIMLIGIMGDFGKSTVLSMLVPLLEKVFVNEEQSLFALDPDGGTGAISFLKKIRSGDVVVARLTDPLVRELYNLRLSPHVAVFTSVPSHNAYKDSPFEILSYQTYNNFVVAQDDVIDKTHIYNFQPKAKMLRTKASLIPDTWDFAGRGIHDRDNAALAVQVAQLFKLDDEIIQDVMESWKPLKGRLELVKKVKQIEFYNDSASITPYSTQAGLMALGCKDVVLILGGVDSGYDYRPLFAVLPQYIKTLILVPGSGTLKERMALRTADKIEVLAAPSVEDAVKMAMDHSAIGYKVLFSPGFGAGGLDQSRKERGERFVRAVRAIK
jgi:UDP-N-acetylmuramoylalanine--D-glutamate ligase